MTYDVYGIGNALVDFLAFVDDEFLTHNGITKGAMTLVDVPGTDKKLTDIPGGFEMCSGGSAANTIVGLVHLGGRAAFTGKAANDKNGAFYVDDLEKAGVRFKSNFADGITGTCVSFITPDGQRSMLTHLGVSSDLSRDDIDEEIIRQSSFLYVEGYQWSADNARDASIHAMELAKKHDVKVAFTYSDPFMAATYRDEFDRITSEYVDLLFCNEDEAKAVAGADTAFDASEYLRAKANMVCITTGPKGALVADEKDLTETPPLKVRHVVDTTGAGDAYAAGVLRGLTLGFDLVCSSMIGSRIAAAVISRIGARLP